MAERDENHARVLQHFFKTGHGQYGEGDIFLGIRNPQIRTIAKRYYAETTLHDIQQLLASPYHEIRFCALVIMILQYKKATDSYKSELFRSYVDDIGRGINNWDLVDISCPHIVGAYLDDKPRQLLYELATGGLWHKRVSVISTFYFLRHGDIRDALCLCEQLVGEKHDLLQKAVGWTLREIGKIDDMVLRQFLNEHAATMPRTMLRYALEKLPPDDRQYFMTLAKR